MAADPDVERGPPSTGGPVQKRRPVPYLSRSHRCRFSRTGTITVQLLK